MITVEHLTKRYGEHVAVDDLSFTVETGEICGLLGPNGAGKSTTMNIMTGYLSASEGRVLIDGSDVFENPTEAKRKIGYLPEVPPLYPDMTPIEYLRFVTALRKIPSGRCRELIERAVDRTDIRPVSNRLIRNLSKGYRQRVGLAAALAVDPSVIILDEPTVGLDPKQIIEIRELIRSLGKEHTVLLSSHILSEVSAVCDKVLILSHGRLAAFDTPENLEHRAQGTDILSLTAIGTREAVSAALAALFPDAEIMFEACEDPCSVRARISGASEGDRRAEISLALAAQGIAVTDMHRETRSLEDVFLELTQAADSDEPSEADESAWPREIALDASGRIVLHIDAAIDEDDTAVFSDDAEKIAEPGADTESGAPDASAAGAIPETAPGCRELPHEEEHT